MSLEERLRNFFDERGFSYRIGTNSFVGDCVNPNCGKEEHFWIRRRSGRSICFKCKKKYRWRELVAAIAKVPVNQAHGLLYGSGGGEELEIGMDLTAFDEKSAREEDEESDTPDVPVCLGPDFCYIEKSLRGVEYLIRRGVARASTILAFDVRYHAMMDAIVFPIRMNGVTYGWQARRIDPQGDELRLISHTFNKSHFLLNYDRAKIEKRIIVVEGPVDCLHTDVPGFSSVASLGKGISLDQIELLLSSAAEELYLGLDPDAFEEVYELIDLIGSKKKLYRPSLPPNREDFGEATVVEVLNSMDRALRVSVRTDLLEVYFK